MDIDFIVDFGMERWGETAGELYANGMRQRIRELLNHPRRYPPVEKIRPGLRSFLHRRHRIFYAVGDDEITIVRILHQQADWQRLFP